MGIRLGRASPAPRLLPKVPRQGAGQAGTMQQQALSGTCASTQPPILQVGDWQGQEKGREGRERMSALSAALLGQEPLPSPGVPAHGAVPVHTACTHTQTCKHTHRRPMDLQTHTHTCAHRLLHACTHRYKHTHVVISCAHTCTQTSAGGLCLSLLHTHSPCSLMPPHTRAQLHREPDTHVCTHRALAHTSVCTQPVHPMALRTHGQTDLQLVSTHAHQHTHGHTQTHTSPIPSPSTHCSPCLAGST